jgi:hypothetical protein
MEMSKKVLVALLIVAIIVTAVTMAALFVPAVRLWFTNISGPAGTGAINLLQTPLKWALTGGANTIALWGVGLIVLFGFAYWVWHWDIGYKFTGATTPNPASGYDNSMKREPEEPERSQTTLPKQ